MRYLIGCLISLLVCLTAIPSWAITYVGGKAVFNAGTTTGVTTGLTDLAGGSDAAVAVGDLVVITYCTASPQVDRTLIIANSSGGTNYTLLGTEKYVNDSNATNMRVAYRFMPDPVETSAFLSETVNGGSGAITDAMAWHIAAFRGVHATPLEQAVQEGTGINTAIIDPGSITPTTAGTFILLTGCGSLALGGVYTQGDSTDFRSATSPDTQDSTVGAGYLAWASGAYAPATYGGGGTDTVGGSYAWMLVALAPAAVGGVTCRGALMLMGVGGC